MRSTQATEPNVLRVTFLDSSRWPWNWVTLLWLYQPTWPRPSIDRLACPLSCGCLLWSIPDAPLLRLHISFGGKAEFVYIWFLQDTQEPDQSPIRVGQATHLPLHLCCLWTGFPGTLMSPGTSGFMSLGEPRVKSADPSHQTTGCRGECFFSLLHRRRRVHWKGQVLW